MASRWREAGLALVTFGVLAALAAWPLVTSPAAAYSLQPDTYQNMWNFWWVHQALFGEATSMWHTDAFFHPDGVSLARHTLSPVNAIPGALLAGSVGPEAQYNLLYFLQLVLGGLGLYALARELGAPVAGALFGGVVYSLAPFHWFHIAQLNVASVGFLPLALLGFTRVWRHGGAGNTLMAALACGLVAASASYYLVYAILIAGLFLVAGGLQGGQVPWRTGALRLVIAGALAGVVVAWLRWPLLAEWANAGQAQAADGIQAGRSNDLLGYNLVGPPEHIVVSWPTMLGYTSLLVIGLGFRGLAGLRFWLLVGALFFLLGLGPDLIVAGKDTGLPLPYRIFPELPVLSLLRKPDRAFVVVQLVVALLAARAWGPILARCGSRKLVVAALGIALVTVELCAAPLRPFPTKLSPFWSQLADDPDVRAVVEFPSNPGTFFDGRYLRAQLEHGKPIASGYTTSLALGPEQAAQAREWTRAWRRLQEGQPDPLVQTMERTGTDLVVLHKTQWSFRMPIELDGSMVWSPFFLERRALVGSRQRGLVERPLPAGALSGPRAALLRRLGEPAFEDDRILAFRLPR